MPSRKRNHTEISSCSSNDDTVGDLANEEGASAPAKQQAAVASSSATAPRLMTILGQTRLARQITPTLFECLSPIDASPGDESDAEMRDENLARLLFDSTLHLSDTHNVSAPLTEQGYWLD